jgi:hypothetical protein
MSDHTQGKVLHRGHHVVAEIDGDKFAIANCWSGPFAPTREIAAENARRLAACWNLLTMFSTEHIESNLDLTKLEALIAERDRLREVLRMAVAYELRAGRAFQMPEWIELAQKVLEEGGT